MLLSVDYFVNFENKSLYTFQTQSLVKFHWHSHYRESIILSRRDLDRPCGCTGEWAGEGAGGRTPLENYKAKGFLGNSCPVPWKITKLLIQHLTLGYIGPPAKRHLNESTHVVSFLYFLVYFIQCTLMAISILDSFLKMNHDEFIAFRLICLWTAWHIRKKAC